MSDVVLLQINCWIEKRCRAAVIVPSQRVGETGYAIVAEVNIRSVDQLSALHWPCVYLRQVVE